VPVRWGTVLMRVYDEYAIDFDKGDAGNIHPSRQAGTGE
jgi:hypothetical protein